MNKSILNLGRVLDKAKQKQINGGGSICCSTNRDCASIPFSTCNNGFCD